MSIEEKGGDVPPDDELVRLASAGPESPGARQAAAVLLGRYQDRVYLWCHRIVRDPERARDFAQDALLSAYRALPGFEGRAPFAAWLFTIARNRCFRAMRPASLTRDEEAELELLPAGQPSPEEMYDRREEEERMLALVRRELDPDEQRALWLRCYENVAVEDITRLLGLESASGARGLLQRARRKLRSALERDGMGGEA